MSHRLSAAHLDPMSKKTSRSTTWTRHPEGYLRADGAWFLARAARMSTGGTNGWMIFRRVDETRIGRDDSTAYDKATGETLVAVPDLTIRPGDFTGDLYAHDYDAGSLSEAKFTVARTEQETR